MRVAATLARRLAPGDVVALVGDLGAGKTVFVRGLARGLGVPAEVPITSPTFTLMNTYRGRLPIYHFDLYRVADVEEIEAAGVREFLGGDGVAVIEWADRVPEALPARCWRVTIVEGEGADEREIVIAEPGSAC